MTPSDEPPSDGSSSRELDAEAGVESLETWVETRVAGEPQVEAAPPSPDFDEVVRRHGRRLYVLAFRLTGNRAEAEDLSQETLVRGYLAIGRFRGEADFYTYLYRALLNLWKNQIRSRRRWRFVPFSTCRGAESGGP